MRKQFNKIEGNQGENLAVNFLKKQKYKILDNNYRAMVGEIDIVAKDKDTIVFVEVKLRETLAFGRPCETVGKQKQYHIKRSAEEYLIRNKLITSPVRFDIIEIVGQEITHIINAF